MGWLAFRRSLIMWLSEITLQLIFFRLIALAILTGVHGAIIARIAVLLGDKGPKYDGRLSLFPTSHVDPFGAVGTVLFGVGWARPINVDAGQFRAGRGGIVVVILGGFIGLLVASAVLDALVLPALTTLEGTAGLTVAAFLREASSLSIWFALFSLMPVPPLAGGLLPTAFGLRVPQHAQWLLSAAVLLAVASGIVRQVLGPIHAALSTHIIGG